MCEIRVESSSYPTIQRDDINFLTKKKKKKRRRRDDINYAI